MEKILYFSQAHSMFPSIWANNYQVMRMCDGFSSLGFEVQLIVPYGTINKNNYKKINGSVWEFYSVKNKFIIKKNQIIKIKITSNKIELAD